MNEAMRIIHSCEKDDPAKVYAMLKNRMREFHQPVALPYVTAEGKVRMTQNKEEFLQAAELYWSTLLSRKERVLRRNTSQKENEHPHLSH